MKPGGKLRMERNGLTLDRRQAGPTCWFDPSGVGGSVGGSSSVGGGHKERALAHGYSISTLSGLRTTPGYPNPRRPAEGIGKDEPPSSTKKHRLFLLRRVLRKIVLHDFRRSRHSDQVVQIEVLLQIETEQVGVIFLLDRLVQKICEALHPALHGTCCIRYCYS